MILHIDTTALINSQTGKPEFKDPARNWLDSFARSPGSLLVTSRLTILEAPIGPLKQADVQRATRIEDAFNGLVLLEIDTHAPNAFRLEARAGGKVLLGKRRTIVTRGQAARSLRERSALTKQEAPMRRHATRYLRGRITSSS